MATRFLLKGITARKIDRKALPHPNIRTREVLLKTMGAIEYLEAVGVTLPEPEVTEEAEAEAEAPAEEG